jgi:hypothetical protein
MTRVEYEIDDSYRSNYDTLQNTRCGKNIPKVKYDTFNPPPNYPNKCPGDWNDNSFRYPTMCKQIVLDYKKKGYNSLTHDAPQSTSGYFKYMPAYNNDQSGYSLKCRKCDGSFVSCDKPKPK